MINLDGIGVVTDLTNFHLISAYDSGEPELKFEIHKNHMHYNHMQPEKGLNYAGQRYLIKSIDPQRESATIGCQLDLDDFRRMFVTDYLQENISLLELLNFALQGSSWAAEGAELITGRKNVEITAGVALDMLRDAQGLWKCVFKYDTARKVVTAKAIDSYEVVGAYFTDELNVSDAFLKADSLEFCTRLVPIGAEGMTIGPINNGIDYVENYQYTNKVVTRVWEASSIDDINDLKNAAIEQLEVASMPFENYDLSVIDLAAIKEEYNMLGFDVGDKITYIDPDRGVRTIHQIVKTERYPFEPERDKIELNQEAKKLEHVFQEFNNALGEKIAEGKKYYGTSITKKKGIHIRRMDGVSEAIFNSDTFTMRSKDINGDMKDAIFFDALARKYRIGGDVLIDGSLSSDANFTDALYAEQGDISQLTVDQLSTSKRLSKYLNQDEADDNYLEIYEQGIYWTTAKVSRDSSGNPITEQLTNRYGDRVYWAKDISEAQIQEGYPFVDGVQIYTTTEVTDYPVTVYQYDKLTKLSQQFYYHGSLDEYIPKITLGVGDETGMAKGYIEKDIHGLVLSYDKRDGTKNFVRIGENGFETNMPLESSQPDYAIYEKNSNINIPSSGLTSQMTFTLKKNAHVYFYHNFCVECTDTCTLTYTLSLDGRVYSTGYYNMVAGKNSGMHQYIVPAAESGNRKFTWNYQLSTGSGTLVSSMAWINSVGLANGALPVPPDTKPHIYDKLRGRIIGADVGLLEVKKLPVNLESGMQGEIQGADVGISVVQRRVEAANANLRGQIQDADVGITTINRNTSTASASLRGNIIGAEIGITFPE